MNLYEVLGVPKTCSDEDIKKAYRKLALKWHPDRCREPGANEKFQEISNAYNILSDKEKRANYDRYGTAEPNVPRGSSGANFHFSSGNIDPQKIFEEFFGAGSPNDMGLGGFSIPMNMNMQPKQQIKDFHCTLEEIYNGCTKRFKINGELVEISIRPGDSDGKKYQRRGCIFRLRQKPHSRFTRKGNDLHMSVELSLAEYINGFSIVVEHLDGKKKKISNHYGGTKIGGAELLMTAQGLGMPPDGNLVVHFQIQLPDKITL